MPSAFKLSRRRLLKGVATAIALPPLDAMFNPNGTLYADDEPFSLLYTDTTSAFKARQQLLSISNGRTSLLWQETNHTPE